MCVREWLHSLAHLSWSTGVYLGLNIELRLRALRLIRCCETFALSCVRRPVCSPEWKIVQIEAYCNKRWYVWVHLLSSLEGSFGAKQDKICMSTSFAGNFSLQVGQGTRDCSLCWGGGVKPLEGVVCCGDWELGESRLGLGGRGKEEWRVGYDEGAIAVEAKEEGIEITGEGLGEVNWLRHGGGLGEGKNRGEE